MNKFAAQRTRDSIQRAIYGHIFQQIIDAINGDVVPDEDTSKVQIFDVPGFGMKSRENVSFIRDLLFWKT